MHWLTNKIQQKRRESNNKKLGTILRCSFEQIKRKFHNKYQTQMLIWALLHVHFLVWRTQDKFQSFYCRWLPTFTEPVWLSRQVWRCLHSFPCPETVVQAATLMYNYTWCSLLRTKMLWSTPALTTSDLKWDSKYSVTCFADALSHYSCFKLLHKLSSLLQRDW